jgi:hypothetical protein
MIRNCRREIAGGQLIAYLLPNADSGDSDHARVTNNGKPEQRQALFENTARSMNGVPTEIQQRWIGSAR